MPWVREHLRVAYLFVFGRRKEESMLKSKNINVAKITQPCPQLSMRILDDLNNDKKGVSWD